MSENIRNINPVEAAKLERQRIITEIAEKLASPECAQAVDVATSSITARVDKSTGQIELFGRGPVSPKLAEVTFKLDANGKIVSVEAAGYGVRHEATMNLREAIARIRS